MSECIETRDAIGIIMDRGIPFFFCIGTHSTTRYLPCPISPRPLSTPNRSVSVIKHYQDFHEDQFDFHMYCIRKVTLRTYCKLLKFEDEIWGMPHYGRAAEEVIRIRLHLLDNPSQAKEDEEPDYSKMTAAERKKAKNIARKKQKKREAALAAGGGGENNKSADGGGGNKKTTKPHVVDEDPEGKELLASDHLEEARKLSSLLVRHAPKRISAWALQYDVSVRRGKMLMALQVRIFMEIIRAQEKNHILTQSHELFAPLISPPHFYLLYQALYKMKSIDGGDHRLFSRIINFSLKLTAANTKDDSPSAAASGLIAEEFPMLMNGKSLVDFVKLNVEKVKADSLTSLPMRVAVARAMLSTEPSQVEAAAELVLSCKLNARGVSVENCREALKFMESLGESNKYMEKMMTLIMVKFPFAKDF